MLILKIRCPCPDWGLGVRPKSIGPRAEFKIVSEKPLSPNPDNVGNPIFGVFFIDLYPAMRT